MGYSVLYTKPRENGGRKHCSKSFATATDASAFIDRIEAEYGLDEMKVMKEIGRDELLDDSWKEVG